MFAGSTRLAAGALVAVMLWLAVSMANASAWQVPLIVENANGDALIVRFGVDPLGTDGIDAELGEVELPPWPPSSVFDTRLLLAGTEGLRLDIRDDSETERIHEVQWQAGSGGYPITIRWDSHSLPPAELHISDGYGGAFIPPFSMFDTDSLVIPSQWTYLRRIRIAVVPGEYPFLPPEITPRLPDLLVFDGQQFPELALDDYIEDLDTPVELIQWSVTPSGPPWPEIDESRVLRFRYLPTGAGYWDFVVQAEDPQGQEDHQIIRLTTMVGGAPVWEVALETENGDGASQTSYFGIHPAATDGVDTALGEVALPPWPPAAVFDTRFLLPDGMTHSARDLRESGAGPLHYLLEWQEGEGGYPIVIRWPEALPQGSFQMMDAMGGAFIPPFSMHDTDSLRIPVELSFLSSVQISVIPFMDSVPPVGPTGLTIVGLQGTQVTLSWIPAAEANFDYYEIWYDSTGGFSPEGAWVWDWTEDPQLKSLSTAETTIDLPNAEQAYYARMRAWDVYGNAGAFTDVVQIPTGASLNPPWAGRAPWVSQGYPNPFRGMTRFQLSLGAERRGVFSVYDVGGRLVFERPVFADAQGLVMVNWAPGQAGELPPANGIYLCVLRTPAGCAQRKILLLH